MLPYDNNRVPLEEDVDGTDYINASWVNNEQKIGDKAFCNKLIAAQNPLAKTIVHFLQLITEQKIDSIVNLTKLKDGKHFQHIFLRITPVFIL